MKDLNKLRDNLKDTNIKLKLISKDNDENSADNLIDQVWDEEKPKHSNYPVFIHKTNYHGRTVSDNLSKVMEKAKEINWKAVLVTQLDDIAWLTNLRGADISYSPLFIAYAVVYQHNDKNQIAIYYDGDLTEEIKNYFHENSISIKPYRHIFKDLIALPFAGENSSKFKIAVDSK